MIAKAELHVHLEGSITPAMVRQLAVRNKVSVPEEIFASEQLFAWTDFLDFLRVYDVASSVVRTPEDYRDITYDYLAKSAKMGSIYVELSVSPDHARLVGLSYQDHMQGVIAGIKDAQRDFGIEARIIAICVRHFGVDRCLQVVRDCLAHPHPLIVGIGLGGNEALYPPSLFTQVYEIAADGGLGCTVHSGEFDGPRSIWEAITLLPVTRLGHGVRAIEDITLLETIIDRGIVFENCPGSSVALGIFPHLKDYPIVDLLELGAKVTLSSDDPPYFGTSIADEYENAKLHYGLSDEDLLDITRNAIHGAFADYATKERLLGLI